VAFDAVGGKAIDDLAQAVDDGGTIINFGSLGSNMKDTDEKVYGYSWEWPLTVGAPASGDTARDTAVVLRTIYEVLMPASSHFNY
jgi:hypothetical protein